jgi:FixJ family two-component response regulator
MGGTPGNVCVAIIDDDESFCRSSGRMLRMAGYESVAYHSAEEFLADRARRAYTCLLVDIQLVGMSGLEMQRKLVAEGDRTPVIFITAHAEPEARGEALDWGCVGFFRKTDDGERVVKAIETIVAGANAPGRAS